jgi:glycosyltransferase involved in cell wall biosynthesis
MGDEKLKILIATHYFPPQNASGSLRPYSWAKYWSKIGHDVTVITRTKIRKENDLKLDCSFFEVIEIDNIRTMLEKLAVRFDKLLKKINLNNQTDHRKIEPEEKSLKIKNRVLFEIRNLFYNGAIKYGIRTINLLDIGWINESFRKVKQNRYDILMSSFGPPAPHLLGLKIKQQNPDIFWIADYRDLWTQDHYVKSFFPFNLIEEYLERKVNYAADLIITVSEPLANKIKTKYNIENVEVVENGFDTEDLENISPEPYWKDNKFRLVYTGSISPGEREPSLLFEAIREIANSPQKELLNKFEVIFVGTNTENLHNLIQKYGVGEWVKYGGNLPREDALRMQRDAHALIFLEFAEVDGILTGKLFEYLFSGTKILGIGTVDNIGPGKLIKESGHGINFGKDVQKIKDYLVKLLVSGKKEYVEKNIKFLEKFTRKRQAEKVLELVEKYRKQKE